MVKVDASETGVGAVLSQQSPRDQRWHRRMSTTERNYDVGNRELLAVVLALEEWRHWLEGAEHQFVVWTDHNSHQALMALPREVQIYPHLPSGVQCFVPPNRAGEKTGNPRTHPTTLLCKWQLQPGM